MIVANISSLWSSGNLRKAKYYEGIDYIHSLPTTTCQLCVQIAISQLHTFWVTTITPTTKNHPDYDKAHQRLAKFKRGALLTLRGNFLNDHDEWGKVKVDEALGEDQDEALVVGAPMYGRTPRPVRTNRRTCD